MNAHESHVAWIEANQAYLASEFARIKSALSGGSDIVDEVPAAKAALLDESPPAIDMLAALFDLNAFECRVLLLCAGVEVDSELAALCAKAQQNALRQHATFGLAMAIFPQAQWSALTPTRPLRRLRLVELEANHGLTSAPLRIDERILHYLVGVNSMDERLAALVTLGTVPHWIVGEHQAAADRAVRFIRTDSDGAALIHLCGDDPPGQEDVASLAAQNVGRNLFIARAPDLPVVGPDLEQLVTLWQRESVLVQGALLLQCEPDGVTAATRYLVEKLTGPVFLATRDPVRCGRSFVRVDVNKPRPSEQRHLWQQALGATAGTLNGALDDLSGHFRLSARMIFSAGSVLAGSVLRSSDAPALADDLWNSCRSLARPKLEELAQRIVPKAVWNDLVLPEGQKQTLRRLAAQVRHRLLVYETWGFSAKGGRGLGVSALFAGESGTGKTLAAEVLAHELGLDLYCIDLSAVVSKYIGETEKNLKRVFDAAEEGGALLLFDEADALFGKRSDVRDSHDRYANIEVGYLLQRMETYAGLAVLTTNMKSSLDKAFQRRLRFTINFPFPDAEQREAMWTRVFPAKTPTANLDARKLAQLNVTGGNIRNIALNAAFLAAESATAVDMRHLLHAARLESQKIERPLADAETRGWI